MTNSGISAHSIAAMTGLVSDALNCALPPSALREKESNWTDENVEFHAASKVFLQWSSQCGTRSYA